MNFVFQMMNLGIRTDQSAATGVILRRSTSPISAWVMKHAEGPTNATLPGTTLDRSISNIMALLRIYTKYTVLDWPITWSMLGKPAGIVNEHCE